MKKVFELLKKRGIRTFTSIEKCIMHEFRIKDILDLNARLINSMPLTKSAPKDLTPFNFTANSNMTAQHNHCLAWNCRLRRIEETAQFAALYCDKLYILNYFEDYSPESQVIPLNHRQEIELRYQYAGDLKILFALKPLLDAGIVRFTKTKYHFCQTCATKILPPPVLREIDHLVNVITKEYLKTCKARLVREKKLPDPYSMLLKIQGPEELYEQGGMVRLQRDFPKWLLRKSGFGESRSRKRVYHLTKSDMHKIQIPKTDIEHIATDIIFQHILSQLLNTKYLTDRNIDSRFLSSITAVPEFRQYNEILNSEFICKIPVLQNIPIKDILKLRQKEFEAFLVFRNTLSEVITNYLAKQKPLAQCEAHSIYQDVIYPELCKLNALAKSLKKSTLFKNVGDLVVTSSLLTFGLCSGILPPDVKMLYGAVGGFHLSRELINSLTSTLKSPEEIRNHNLFFLWKLSQKSKPIHA